MSDEKITPEMQEMLLKKQWRRMREAMANWPMPDIADLLNTLEDEDATMMFFHLPKDIRGDVFDEMEPDLRERLIGQMSKRQFRDIVLEMSPDDRTDLFEDLPGNVTQSVIELLPPEERREAVRLLGYPEDSTGRLMTPDYVTVRQDWTVEQALDHIRKHGHDAEIINMIYVTDERGRMLDDIRLRKFILTDSQEKVETLMDREFISISPFEDQEKAAQLVRRYDLYAIPVVDHKKVLLGIVTVDDILDVIDEEVTEDVQKIGGVLPLYQTYKSSTAWTLYRKRVVWLMLLAVSGFVTSSILASFKDVLGVVIALAFFVPLLIDAGGNTSSQAATLVIRALATGDLTFSRWFSVVKKELVVGCLLGLTLGAVLYFWGSIWGGDSGIALVLGLSIFFIVMWANLVGSLLPILLTKLKLDPAIVSIPMLTTLMDISGLLIYFFLAIVILQPFSG